MKLVYENYLLDNIIICIMYNSNSVELKISVYIYCQIVGKINFFPNIAN